jgi:hypothetical protein
MLYLLLTAAAVAVFATAALLLTRARAARRWAAAVDRFAEREIARSRLPDPAGLSGRLGQAGGAPARGTTFHRPRSRTAAPRAAFFRRTTHEPQR